MPANSPRLNSKCPSFPCFKCSNLDSLPFPGGQRLPQPERSSLEIPHSHSWRNPLEGLEQFFWLPGGFSDTCRALSVLAGPYPSPRRSHLPARARRHILLFAVLNCYCAQACVLKNSESWWLKKALLFANVVHSAYSGFLEISAPLATYSFSL